MFNRIDFDYFVVIQKKIILKILTLHKIFVVVLLSRVHIRGLRNVEQLFLVAICYITKVATYFLMFPNVPTCLCHEQYKLLQPTCFMF